MKVSRFNLFYKQQGGTAVFNTATGKWCTFSLMSAARLRAGTIDGLPERTLRQAAAIGAVVEDCFDEDRWYRLAYERRMTDRKTARYVCALTFSCNLRCPYCFERGPRAADGPMTREFAARLVAAVKQRCASDGTRRLCIMLFGGEPLLELDVGLFLLREFAEWCADSGVSFMATMSSNGVLFTKEKVRLLSPYLDSVQVTLDGPRHVHDRIRRTQSGRGTFDRILDSVRMLSKEGIGVHIRTQASLDNAFEIMELLEGLKKDGILGLPKVQASVAVLREFSKWATCEYRKNYFEPGSELEREVIRLSESVLPARRPAVQILPCVADENLFCVDPAGNLFKCITNITNLDRRVGYLDDSGAFKLTEHYRARASRNPLTFDDCRACPYLPLCGGGCPTSALNRWKTYGHSYCTNNKAILDSRIERLIDVSSAGG
ncbi:MAG: radical SAM protein [Phycisphaerales bacterium]|nr:MAG: radical SAM protein [Phycisphaerales bacterium]